LKWQRVSKHENRKIEREGERSHGKIFKGI